MEVKRGIVALSLLSACSMPTWAQQLKGVVTDKSSKEALIGAVVTAVKNNSKANDNELKTVTDIDGNFTLSGLKDGTYTLYINYVGYKTQQIDGVQVKGGKETDALAITLQPDEQQLKEVTITAVERHNTDAAMRPYSATSRIRKALPPIS